VPTRRGRGAAHRRCVNHASPVRRQRRIRLPEGFGRWDDRSRSMGHLAAVPHQPAELLDPVLFPTLNDVERHLFDIFIPAAYRAHPDQSRRCPWTADQAKQWLVFLARDLEAYSRAAPEVKCYNG
jgi:hypothetical protein